MTLNLMYYKIIFDDKSNDTYLVIQYRMYRYNFRVIYLNIRLVDQGKTRTICIFTAYLFDIVCLHNFLYLIIPS